MPLCDGGNCWCKVTHPFESEWIYIHTYGASCPDKCPEYCANSGFIGNYQNFRYAAIMVTGMDDDYTVSFK